MKLTAVLLAAAAAQDEDRWSFYDYSIPNDGRVGHAVQGTTGGHEGNRRFCHSTLDTLKIHRWDVTKNGYFAWFNPVECVGEEMFCTIEERAHFGQIIGIRAGCAQMMNHPQVPTIAPITASPENKNHYNQEAARGASFTNGGTTVNIFYGIGGCLALPAQNGPDVHDGTASVGFSSSLINNYWMGSHGGYGQNQCLRFGQASDARTNLLPFGVSVCRACCIARQNVYDSGPGPCNFWPYGSGGAPTGNTAAEFVCKKADASACTFAGGHHGANGGSDTTCEICAEEMFPNFSMVSQPDYSASTNLFETGTNPFCNGSACSPATVYSGQQQIVG
jgi:hypothetical protein